MSEPMNGGRMRFAGYASVFDKPDRGGDVVRRGAFANAGRGTAPVPLLWQHDPKRPIGLVEKIEEDAHGLRVIGRLSDTGQARDAGALLRDGVLDGLSFGYRVREASPAAGRAGRILTAVDLLEVSLVTFPMQPLARIHAVEAD